MSPILFITYASFKHTVSLLSLIEQNAERETLISRTFGKEGWMKHSSPKRSAISSINLSVLRGRGVKLENDRFDIGSWELHI